METNLEKLTALLCECEEAEKDLKQKVKINYLSEIKWK